MASMEFGRDRAEADRYLHERGLLEQLRNLSNEDEGARHLLRYIRTAGLRAADQPKETLSNDGAVQAENVPLHENEDGDDATEETYLDETRHPQVSLRTLTEHLHDLSGASPGLLRAMVANAVNSIVSGEERLREINLSDLLNGFVEERPLGISVRLGELSTKLVEGKEGYLLRVITNLIANAKKAMLSRGKSPGLIIISTEETELGTRIIVEDEGGGIPEEMLKDLFESGTVGIEGGTGRGLKGAKRLLEGWGKIEAQNTIDGAGELSGARFTIELQESGELDFSFLRGVKKAPTLTELRVSSEKPRIKPYILVVEDDLVNKFILVKMIEAILAESGLKSMVDVVTTVSADETLARMRELAEERVTLPMCVFMDRQIQGSQSGLKTAIAMRRHADPKIIMVTASASEGDRMQYSEMGMELMRKPFSIGDLVRSLGAEVNELPNRGSVE